MSETTKWPNPDNLPVRVGVTEDIAKIVYEAMCEVQPPSVSTKPWVENGNAISQDVARYAARRILALTTAPVPPVVGETLNRERLLVILSEVVARWSMAGDDYYGRQGAYEWGLTALTAAAAPAPTATVLAIVDAAEAYEKKHGHWQDYRMSLRDEAFPVDKTERAIVVAYRKHRAALTAALRPEGRGSDA